MEQLFDLLPPPEMPDGLNRSWQSVEEELGLVLPDDYKRFIDHYGSGCICAADAEFASIVTYNLRSVSNAVAWVSAAGRRYTDDRQAGYEHTFPSYPEPGGLLPWATTPEGDFFNWRTVGEANNWDVVFYQCSCAEMVLLEGHAFSRVLVDLLMQRSPLMPRSFSLEGFSPPCRFTEEEW